MKFTIYEDSNIMSSLTQEINIDNGDKYSLMEMHGCLSEVEQNNILLRHELKYLRWVSIAMTMQQFHMSAMYVFDRYKNLGGQYLDDVVWIMHDTTSSRYTIYNTEIVFENTVHKDYIMNNELNEYLTLLINRLNQLAVNIRVSIHTHFSERDELYFILLKCCDTYAICANSALDELLETNISV